MIAPSERFLVVGTAVVLLCGAMALMGNRRTRRRAGRRLRGLVLNTAPVGSSRRFRPARLVGPLVGAAVALSYPHPVGFVCAAVFGFLLDRVVRRWESPSRRAARRRAERDLPFALDMAAAALRSGASPDRCALTVGAALGGPLGDQLGQVGRALALGAEPRAAWEMVRDVAGAERLVAAAVRGSHSGAALAGALSRIADDLRSARLAVLEAHAHRAGVLVVLPLGLCFLPAFVTGGLAPVVIAMLGKVLP